VCNREPEMTGGKAPEIEARIARSGRSESISMHAHDYRQLSVLYVDDEEDTCKLFRLALEPEFAVLTAASAADALQILRAEDSRVGVVISDQRMPGESGAVFLTQVRHEDPMTVRILTTAYFDLDAAIEAVNRGSIYKYVVKPWDLNDLRATLRQAMEYRLLRQERDLLVNEKLATLQHLLVADRVRSLAVLARGLSHHIRNALTPLESHVFEARAELDGGARSEGDSHPLHEIWTDAETVNRHLLDMVENVSAATIDAKYDFDDHAPVTLLLERGHEQARESAEPLPMERIGSSAPVPLRCDVALMTRMFAALLRQMARLGGGSGALTAEYLGTTSVWGTPAEWLRLRATGAWNRQAVASLFTPFAMAPYGAGKTDADLLTAFFIVHHHGGTLELHTQAPEGPGFELKLPHDPFSVERPPIEKNLLERLFLHAEDWQRVKRSR
jgi:FixJ family two-component response regulator